MKFPFSILLAMSLIACGEEEPKEEVDPLTVDDDGDGFSEEQGDCDDANADLSPGATEVCDEIDNDCDGDIDDADSSVDLSTGSVFYADTDGDTFGDAGAEVEACALPEDAVENMDDCDDTNADINPDADEVCDEVDNDCDAMIDDEDDSLDGSTGSTFYADADGDGEGDSEGMMMACTMPEGSVENMTDCDDTDAALNNADVDADGFATCADADGIADCDDTGATELTNTSLDGDCDGTLTADDCDDMDAMSTIMADDMDCDGVVTADDCDDADVAVGATDADGDGFIACVDDCDDNDATLYPGVAFNEADTTLCVPDADGDGYAVAEMDIGACFDIQMTDTYGDSWNGNAIEVYEDGVLTDTYANENLDGTTGSETQTVQHCVDSATAAVDFVFIDGSYNSEVEFIIMDSADGTALGMGEGAGTTDLIWEGTTFTDGDTFYSMDPSTLGVTVGLTGGSDCDDADATTFGDDDGDGATYCTTDCDDADATLNADDLDMDGYSTCDDDCDDTPGSCDDGVSLNEADCTTASAVWTAGGEAFNPGATETYYDGIDQNCDGWSDYDADMDGDDAMEYDDGTGVMVPWTGYDCDDSDDTLLSLVMEADPYACYEDADGDGYGDDNPSTTDMSNYGVIAGTDCYDGYSGSTIGPVTFPGAGYNEADPTLCFEDGDGDGYGDMNSYYADVDGTDCDDTDAMLAPNVDTDMDGVFSCDDCDDMDATAQGGMVYDDMDGDGEGDMDDMGTLVCDLTDLDADDDGTDDLSLTNWDCDDMDDTTIGDDDGDGFYACMDDCDDTDEYTFPGAAELDSTTECLTDWDEDGYGYGYNNGCYTFDLADTYGDGWNGGMNIEVFGDGMSVGTATVTNAASANEVVSTEICVDDGAVVEFVFNSGTYASEATGTIYDTDGVTVIGTLTGTGTWSSSSQTLDYSDGMSYTDGDVFYTTTMVGTNSAGGSDADDSDASVW